jgi:TetR/AcrR family transcriptional repressor of uid operon
MSGSAVTEQEELDPYAERILEAAHDQFMEFGLQRTSLDRIAAAAGVSRGTLFNRFTNRDSLLSAVASREIRRAMARIDAEFASARTPEERFIGGVLAAVHVLARNGLLRRLLVTDLDQVLPIVTTESEALLAIARTSVAAHVRTARDDGMTITGDPDLLAELLVRIGHSLLLAPASAIPLDDDDKLAEFARTHILPLLRGCPGH